jgi:sugar O-acyltransferase (sialic acid O-acetyltransferase NeuD family)
MPRLAIYGAGGFGKEVLPIARALYPEVVFVSDEASAPVLGTPVFSYDDLPEDFEIFLAVADHRVRRRLAAKCVARHFPTLIAPSAFIGPGVEIGEGAIFSHFSVATASARIGRHFHCNGLSFVAHDCVIGDFVTFAAKVSCNGYTIIGDGAYLGSDVTLRNGTREKPLFIGAGAVVGCGAVVLKDVEPGTTVVGNPARAMGVCRDDHDALNPHHVPMRPAP